MTFAQVLISYLLIRSCTRNEVSLLLSLFIFLKVIKHTVKVVT